MTYRMNKICYFVILYKIFYIVLCSELKLSFLSTLKNILYLPLLQQHNLIFPGNTFKFVLRRSKFTSFGFFVIIPKLLNAFA